MTALVFMDTETTGLSLDDDIWEFAAIRREADGCESELHLFLEHDTLKCRSLPESFRADHAVRFPSPCSGRTVTSAIAANRIRNFTQKAHIVGAVPNFDTERLERLLRRHHCKPEWHYHLIDVENLAIGYLYGEYRNHPNSRDRAKNLPAVTALPWDSNRLSEQIGVDPEKFERHTAMGDVRWAMAIYDAITAGAK